MDSDNAGAMVVEVTEDTRQAPKPGSPPNCVTSYLGAVPAGCVP